MTQLISEVSKIRRRVLIEVAKLLYIDESFHCIFIGPCLGKKGEASREGQDLIDAVLTFEELIAIFVAVDINLAAIELEEGDLFNDKGDSDMEREMLSSQKNLDEVSNDAVNFRQNGGVGQAILNNLKENYSDFKSDSNSVSGLSECKRMLEMVIKGKYHYDFVEGMGCSDGCIGGPGTLVKSAKARGILKKMSREECKILK